VPHDFIRESTRIARSRGRNCRGTRPEALKYLLCVLCVLCGLSVFPGCTDKSVYTSEGLTIRFLRSESYTFTRAERRAIDEGARAAIAEVRRLLPGVPAHIELTVRPGANVIPETGEGGDAMPPNGIMLTIDPSRPGGVMAIMNAWLRPFMFHELHHLARYTAESPRSMVEHAVSEGMATVFERDVAGSDPLWGRYPDNVGVWATEILALPPDLSRKDWQEHSNGRRWVSYKVGTYWVDRAMRASGGSAATLVTTPTTEILRLAGQK
jgi:hypothetical protein